MHHLFTIFLSNYLLPQYSSPIIRSYTSTIQSACLTYNTVLCKAQDWLLVIHTYIVMSLYNEVYFHHNFGHYMHARPEGNTLTSITILYYFSPPLISLLHWHWTPLQRDYVAGGIVKIRVNKYWALFTKFLHDLEDWRAVARFRERKGWVEKTSARRARIMLILTTPQLYHVIVVN